LINISSIKPLYLSFKFNSCCRKFLSNNRQRNHCNRSPCLPIPKWNYKIWKKHI